MLTYQHKYHLTTKHMGHKIHYHRLKYMYMNIMTIAKVFGDHRMHTQICLSKQTKTGLYP